MKVSTLVLAGALAAFVAAPAQAQQPDFSGTWELDRGASEIPEFRGGRGGGRGGRGGGPGRGGAGRQGGPGGFGAAAATLVITQSSDLLTVEQQTPRGSRSASYRLDGNESTTSGPRGDLVTTSSWDGATLLTVGTMELSTPRGDFSMDLVEQRSLSADGRTLTVESMRMLPFGEISTRLVYRKDDDQ
jgi:hypothetical protein